MKDIYTLLKEREQKFLQGNPLKHYARNGIVSDPEFNPQRFLQYSGIKPVDYPQAFAFLGVILY